MTDKKRPIPPVPPVGPPVRRIVNEKVINKKEIEEWDNRSRKR